MTHSMTITIWLGVLVDIDQDGFKCSPQLDYTLDKGRLS